MSRATLLLALLVGCSSATARPVTPTRAPGVCLADTGCPARHEPTECSDSYVVRTLDDVAHDADVVGHDVTVLGALVETPATCTKEMCKPGVCCNTCTASLALAARGTTTPVILIAGERLACLADEKTVCCPIAATGQTLAVHGTLMKAGDTLTLTDATVCEP